MMPRETVPNGFLLCLLGKTWHIFFPCWFLLHGSSSVRLVHEQAEDDLSLPLGGGKSRHASLTNVGNDDDGKIGLH
jgi:hypothetical protein